MASADLLLHPVRLRIVQALLGDRALTTAQLGAELDDVAPATLYRHVAALADAGVLRVVDERASRGATERTYALRVEAASVGPDELAAMTAEDHRRAFGVFVASLLADFERYLARGDVDLVRDRVGYRQVALNLSDEELAEMSAEMSAAVVRHLGNSPGPGRVRRVLSTVLMPADARNEQ